MKKIMLCFLVLFCCFNSNAQTAVDSVKAVINKMFAAMKNSDAAGLQDCLADSAILQTITSSGTVRNEPIKQFIAQISSLPKNAADERITFDVVKTDNGLAMAWTPYQFYYNGKFSHCGVNSFQLVRFNGAWKIQYIIDTRRKSGCL
jgi:hypothetical protein